MRKLPLLLMLLCGCGNNNPPPQPSEAKTVEKIVWTMPTGFNIAVPEITTHGAPKKAGYTVTGQLVDGKGKPVRVGGINLVCIASAPNCDASKEVAGVQNIFVFKPGKGAVQGPPGAGVFEGHKIEAQCCYIQISKKTDDKGQFTLSFFVESDVFYQNNRIILNVSALMIKDSGAIIRRGLTWNVVVPEPISSGQSINLLNHASSLKDAPPNSTEWKPQGLLDPDLLPICIVPCFGLMNENSVFPPTCSCDVNMYLDSDSDGVPDCTDLCPNNPLVWDNPICDSSDIDQDNVADYFDACPENPLVSNYDTLIGLPCGCETNIILLLHPEADANFNCVVEIAEWENCATAPGSGAATGCEWADLDVDGDVDQSDFGTIQVAEQWN